MTKYIFYFAILFISLTAFTCENDDDFVINDVVSFDFKCNLHDDLKEISGIIPFGDNLLGFADSGSKASLFELNTDCEIVKEYNIIDAVNNDWEAIAINDGFIYIGDFGNNFGNRTNLEIIKIDVNDLAEETPIFSRLSFTYEDQDNFETRDEHDFDCEAMIVDGITIYLLTKNRESNKTHVYHLNILETEQIANRKDDLSISMLVTDAYYHKEEGNVLVTSYFYDDESNSYFNQIHRFTLENQDLTINRRVTTGMPLEQVESVCILKNGLYIASEAEGEGSAELYEVDYFDYINQ